MAVALQRYGIRYGMIWHPAINSTAVPIRWRHCQLPYSHSTWQSQVGPIDRLISAVRSWTQSCKWWYLFLCIGYSRLDDNDVTVIRPHITHRTCTRTNINTLEEVHSMSWNSCIKHWLKIVCQRDVFALLSTPSTWYFYHQDRITQLV